MSNQSCIPQNTEKACRPQRVQWRLSHFWCLLCTDTSPRLLFVWMLGTLHHFIWVGITTCPTMNDHHLVLRTKKSHWGSMESTEARTRLGCFRGTIRVLSSVWKLGDQCWRWGTLERSVMMVFGNTHQTLAALVKILLLGETHEQRQLEEEVFDFRIQVTRQARTEANTVEEYCLLTCLSCLCSASFLIQLRITYLAIALLTVPVINQSR